MAKRIDRRSHSLDRPRGRRNAGMRFLVFCEGAVTERGYFEFVRTVLRGSLIQLEVSKERGDPLRLVQQAVRTRDDAADRARRLRDDNVRFDSVWCVVDVDEHPRLEEAVALAKQEKINMAISNPCFELWCLLHFADQTAHLTCQEATTRLRLYIPDYGKDLDCRRLEGRYEAARDRAMQLGLLHARHGHPTDDNPSSNVWILIEELREKAGPPFAGLCY